MSEYSAPVVAVRTAGVLLVFTLIFTGLMAGTYRATRDTIAASAEQEKMKLIDEVLARAEYDNALLADWVEIPPQPKLGLEEPTRVFRARRAGAPAALVFEAAAPDGYSGRIQLIVAVLADGSLAGVRVTQHKETPGLGDYIEPRKDRNKQRPWITQFNRLSYAEVSAAQWKVKKDGGRFDYVTGATITARAVTNALGRAADFAAANAKQIFTAAAQSKWTPQQP